MTSQYSDDFSSDTSGDYYAWNFLTISGGVASGNNNCGASVLIDIPASPTNVTIEVDFTITPTGIYTLSDSKLLLNINDTEYLWLVAGRYLRSDTSGTGSDLDDYGASSINNGTVRFILDDAGGGDVDVTREVYFGASLALSHSSTTSSGTGWADILDSVDFPSAPTGCSTVTGFAGQRINPFATITYTFDNFLVDWT